jgi:hypothetical protein
MNTELARPLSLRRPSRKVESPTHLIACSLCLRVLRGSEWVEAERVISELRSFELEAPPRMRSGVCEVCAESIFSRRAQVDGPIAA